MGACCTGVATKEHNTRIKFLLVKIQFESSHTCDEWQLITGVRLILHRACDLQYMSI